MTEINYANDAKPKQLNSLTSQAARALVWPGPSLDVSCDESIYPEAS